MISLTGNGIGTTATANVGNEPGLAQSSLEVRFVVFFASTIFVILVLGLGYIGTRTIDAEEVLELLA